MEHLVDRALRDHPFTIAACSMAQNPWRVGYLRLRPEVTLPAVRAIVAALEAAGWTVEPSTAVEDELRVRLRGQLACPATHVGSAGRWYCDLERDHHHEHRDNETLETWDDDAPERAVVASGPAAPGARTGRYLTSSALVLPSADDGLAVA